MVVQVALLSQLKPFQFGLVQIPFQKPVSYGSWLVSFSGLAAYASWTRLNFVDALSHAQVPAERGFTWSKRHPQMVSHLTGAYSVLFAVLSTVDVHTLPTW